MNIKNNIGVVGSGFVGGAVRETLQQFYTVYTYDIKRDLSSCENLEELVYKSKFIFVCLPTPMKRTGQCDISHVKNTILEINKICETKLYKDRIVIIKSTVIPGTTDKLNERCENISILFSPEFLTEANSYEDFKNQSRIIIGGPRPASSYTKTMFRKAFPLIPIIKTGAKYAEVVKYFTNCFLATKISFANEMYELCDAINIDYDKVVEYALYDNRLGKSHFTVPGPDGDFGFGGHCLPKDLTSMIYYRGGLGLSSTMLDATKRKNFEVRTNRDWEKMEGRAVTNEE